MSSCKLYHATRKDIYDNIISKEGLKPICNPLMKTYPTCEDKLYFTTEKNEAIYFAEVEWGTYSEKSPSNPEGKQLPFVVMEIDLIDVLDVCGALEAEHRTSDNELSVQVADRKQCIIPPEKIKVVYTKS